MDVFKQLELSFTVLEPHVVHPKSQDFIENLNYAGIAEIEDLQDKQQQVCYLGHCHHVSLSPGYIAEPLVEAFEKYSGYDVIEL